MSFRTEQKEKYNELMDQLTKIQNQPKNANRDILTFSGFMNSLEELENYIKLQSA